MKDDKALKKFMGTGLADMRGMPQFFHGKPLKYDKYIQKNYITQLKIQQRSLQFLRNLPNNEELDLNYELPKLVFDGLLSVMFGPKYQSRLSELTYSDWRGTGQ